MIFTDMHMKVLKDFVNQISNNIEFEIRLGKFNFDKNTKKSCFDSNVEIDFFYAIKMRMEHFNVQCSTINTVEYIYNNVNNGNIKRIIMENGGERYMIKQTYKKYDIYDYDLRLSLASEKFVESEGDLNINKDNYEIVRHKTRYSFNMTGCGVLDLTIVKQINKDGVEEMKYEMELEIRETRELDTNNILYILVDLLQNRQKNFYVISGLERRNVINEYKSLVNNYYFIGAQPETLHKDQITVLYKKMYSVTDKADGDRYLMFIDKGKNVYFIDNNINNIIKTDIKSNLYYSTLIDGEVVRTSTSINFLAFDLIVYNGKDIRGNNQYLLKNRLEILQNVVNNVTKNERYIIEMKRYIYKNVFLGSKILMDNANYYKNDGLIFTPMDEPYPVTKKWSSLLKWKPCELNTIDLYSVKVSDNKWQLYVQHNENKNGEKLVKGTEKVLFDVQKLCKTNNNNLYTTFETEFDESYIDPTTNESFMSNTVIEYSWDQVKNRFIPLRTRWDKTINPKKHGNFSQVACDIWNNIHNPITQDLLLKFTIYNNNEDIFYDRMRKFHNKIKEFLYNRYCNKKEYLLELCSGKGGDLHKWIYNGIKNVQGYDISDKNIIECKKRLQSVADKIKYFNYDFYKLDLNNSSSSKIIYNNNNNKQFDVVCCQFGLHYFFSSESSFQNIINVLDNCLMNGGYFVVTFMDNGQIDKLFNGENVRYSEQKGEIVYYIEKFINKDSNYGNKLKIVLNGNNILGEGSEEYIINFQDFNKKMMERGYECVETELFQDLYKSYKNMDGYNLLECEQDISFLNRYCVFKKVKKNVINGIKSEISHINVKNTTGEIIDLHNNNLSVYKINTIYDVLDVLNCVEYKYYKNDYTNKMIESFEDIKEHIDNVYFIKNPLDINEYNGHNCIYITFYKHVIEKKSKVDENDIENEILEYNNWYIIFHKNQIYFKISSTDTNTNTNTDVNTDVNTNVDADKEVREQTNEQENVQVNEGNVQVNEGNVSEKLIELRQLLDNKKVTVVVLKEYLKKFGLKMSGNKEDLTLRLREYLKNEFKIN
jgi:SAM-dependent methyltransferase